jgi:ParB-like chromosome segregation protein Spo0J
LEDQPYQVMPPLSEEEYEALKASVARHGVETPVVEDAAGNLIDGHYRVRAWRELRDAGHDIPDYPRTVRSDLETDAEKRELAWRLNMQRRHLNQGQKREAIAAKLKETPEWADSRIAELLGVDGKTVRSVRDSLEQSNELPKVDTLVGKDGKHYPRNQTRDPGARLTKVSLSPERKLSVMPISQELSVSTSRRPVSQEVVEEEPVRRVVARIVKETERPLYLAPDRTPEGVGGAKVEKIEWVKSYLVRMTNGLSAIVGRKRLLDEGYKKCPHCKGHGLTKEEG